MQPEPHYSKYMYLCPKCNGCWPVPFGDWTPPCGCKFPEWAQTQIGFCRDCHSCVEPCGREQGVEK